jgi:hypothetical protein
MSALKDRLVAKYGKKYEVLIADSLNWLRQREPEWGLDKPMDVDEFIKSLIDKAAK